MVDESRADGRKGYLGLVADEQGHCACSSGGAGRSVLIDCHVNSHNNTVTAVPGRRTDPVESVEQGVGGSIAGVDAGGS